MVLKKGLVFILTFLFFTTLMVANGDLENVAAEKAGTEYPGEEDVIVINCDLHGEKEFKVEELMEFESVEEEIIRRDNEGQIYDRYPIKGVLFRDVLASIDRDKKELKGFRVTAGDGYSVEVPRNIFIDRDVILAYEIDNEPLYEGTRPIRVFIPGEEAMYWVRNAVQITLNTDEEAMEKKDPETTSESDQTARIFFFESLVLNLEEIDYPEGEDQKAVTAGDLLAGISASDTVYMLATDGFDKNEEYQTVLDAYFLTQGPNTPAFRSPDLPRGMHVRDLAWIFSGQTGILSVERAMELFPGMQVNDNTGIGLMELAEKFKLKKADEYILEAVDGFSAEVGYEDLKKGIIYIRDSGQVASEFDGLPRNTAIRDLLFIKAVE